jgi:hypothetical protein
MAIHILRDYGPLARLRLPPGWEEKPHTPTAPHTPTSRSFHPPGVHQAEIVIHSWGRTNNKDAQRAWVHLVRRGRQRSLSAQELIELRMVPIYAFNDAGFKRKSVRTENLNGRRVLVIEGNWSEHGLDMYMVVADETRDGAHTYEIYFAAPHRLYALHLDAWLASMRSIRWKPQSIGDWIWFVLRALRFWKRS